MRAAGWRTPASARSISGCEARRPPCRRRARRWAESSSAKRRPTGRCAATSSCRGSPSAPRATCGACRCRRPHRCWTCPSRPWSNGTVASAGSPSIASMPTRCGGLRRPWGAMPPCSARRGPPTCRACRPRSRRWTASSVSSRPSSTRPSSSTAAGCSPTSDVQTHLSPEFAGTPDGQEAEAILRKCVHCGFCTATCPTYQLLGDELDGPRGRIYLIKQVLEGEQPTDKTQLHLDRCLTCRNCESTCPSGVQYGHLVDIGRRVVDATVERGAASKLLRWGLKEGLTSP